MLLWSEMQPVNKGAFGLFVYIFLTHLCVLCSCITVSMKQAFLQNQDPLKVLAFNWPYYTNKHEFLCSPTLKRNENSSSSLLCSFFTEAAFIFYMHVNMPLVLQEGLCLSYF